MISVYKSKFMTPHTKILCKSCAEFYYVCYTYNIKLLNIFIVFPETCDECGQKGAHFFDVQKKSEL